MKKAPLTFDGTVSVHSLRTLRECPRKWLLEQGRRIAPVEAPIYFVEGSIFHALLRNAYMTGKVPKPAGLLQTAVDMAENEMAAARKNRASKSYLEQGHSAAAKAAAGALRYFESREWADDLAAKRMKDKIRTEVGFAIRERANLAGKPVVFDGWIDFELESPSRKLIIIRDHKFLRPDFDEGLEGHVLAKTFGYSLQLSAYARGIREGLPPEKKGWKIVVGYNLVAKPSQRRKAGEPVEDFFARCLEEGKPPYVVRRDSPWTDDWPKGGNVLLGMATTPLAFASLAPVNFPRNDSACRSGFSLCPYIELCQKNLVPGGKLPAGFMERRPSREVPE